MTEDLNIRNNVRLLVLKALDKFRHLNEAAKALGISPRTLSRLKNEFNLRESKEVLMHKKQTA